MRLSIGVIGVPGVVAGILMLGACQPGPVDAGRTGDGAAAGAGDSMTRYLCEDGSVVEAAYPDEDTARVVYKGRSFEMKVAVSASGARYTGGGWEWWTKGLTEGRLTPLPAGEAIAPNGGIACKAEAHGGK
ncbi:MAG: MliC family protein [Bryobacterales bacterium]|nr:MliC family protein [Bryobacterales bacterium]